MSSLIYGHFDILFVSSLKQELDKEYSQVFVNFLLLNFASTSATQSIETISKVMPSKTQSKERLVLDGLHQASIKVKLPVIIQHEYIALYDRYLDSDSPYEINVPEHVKAGVKAEIYKLRYLIGNNTGDCVFCFNSDKCEQEHKFTIGMFDQVKESVMQMVFSDTFIRFIHSSKKEK